jgi:hypothetical protein
VTFVDELKAERVQRLVDRVVEIDPTLLPGSSFLIGQPYEDWLRDQAAGMDVGVERFDAWRRDCVRRIS